jgi:hypothetical protein
MKTTVEQYLDHYLLAFEIYFSCVKCSLYAKRCSLKKKMKIQVKDLKKIDTTQINNDVNSMKIYLDRIEKLMSSKEYNQKHYQYLRIRFDIIVHDVHEYDCNIEEIFKQLIHSIDTFPSDHSSIDKIELYLRLAWYFIHHDSQRRNDAFDYYKTALELAQVENTRLSSDQSIFQLSKVHFQMAQARFKLNQRPSKMFV